MGCPHPIYLTPTQEECDQLKDLASSRLERSGVHAGETGEGQYSDQRTSSGMFFDRGETPFIKQIEDRVAAWTLLPPDNGEGMQVLRYEVGEGMACIETEVFLRLTI